MVQEIRALETVNALLLRLCVVTESLKERNNVTERIRVGVLCPALLAQVVFVCLLRVAGTHAWILGLENNAMQVMGAIQQAWKLEMLSV